MRCALAAEITTGYDDRGRQVKPRVYGRTQADVRAKLDELKKRVSQNLKPKPERFTVAQFLQRWLTTRACAPHVNTKTESSDRSVWLPQIVVEKVLEHQRRQFDERKAAGSGWVETGMVFTTPKGTLLEPRNMLRDFHRVRRNPKLPQIRVQDLRHSVATILKMAGISHQAIQYLLGHSSVRTTQEIYTHLTADGQKQAAAKMDEIFGAVAVKVAVKNAQKKPS